ncbi:DUF6273 domain-containing protein [Paratractidigestivibacter sp.]|uniref:DUF6273 domain-containing protein n=1 Tax=Paratractidigestivibacter sp. TaxID=2847316 RepID=UPI002ABE011E|nr:DUF6273 domain-containing protein [Paratractidigestivibacter sp.]
MRCENCGTELPEGARFCYMCAVPVGETADGDAVAAKGADTEEAGAEAGAAAVVVGEFEDDTIDERETIPVPFKLEGTLPVAAVPLVPVVPASRSVYVQRRMSQPNRTPRSGVNSAPASASNYKNAGWSQNSERSHAGNGEKDAEAAATGAIGAAGDAAGVAGAIDDMKSKLTKAFGSWDASFASLSEKMRQEREIKEAAHRVQKQESTESSAAAEREEERLEHEAPVAASKKVAEPADAEVAEVAADAEAASVDAFEADAVTEFAETVAIDAAEDAPAARPASASAAFRAVTLPDVPEIPSTDDDSIESDDVSAFWSSDPYTDDDADIPAREGYVYAHDRYKMRNKPLIATIIAVAAVVLIGIGAFAAFFSKPAESETPQLKPATEVTLPGQDASDEEEAEPEEEIAVAVEASVNDYSWSDLSKIAAVISSKTSETEALEVAKKYNLCSASGSLDGSQAKTLRLSDGTSVNMRIVGFWHDLKSDGTGHAGISFIADASVGTRAMCESGYTDWGSSTLREWLNGEFLESLPTEVKDSLVSVSKQTNRYTLTQKQEVTDDKVWLASYSELVGPLEDGSDRYYSYNSEGDQYQLFANQGVSWSQASNQLIVGGDCVNWWTRSPDTANAERYLAPRNEDGNPAYSRNPALPNQVGVVPGFCL